MLTYEQIKELIELVGREGLQGVTLERSGFRLHVEGKAPPMTFAAPAPSYPAEPAPPTPAPRPVAAADSEPASAEPAAGSAEELPEDGHILTSPIVGTFYTAPSPDSEPYVGVGDTVSEGQILCIVEAMKLMNEIESEVAGEVLKILPKNGQPVEFGEPLFVIRVR